MGNEKEQQQITVTMVHVLGFMITIKTNNPNNKSEPVIKFLITDDIYTIVT